MKKVQSFLYRGIPVLIRVSNSTALITTIKTSASYNMSDINLLKSVAEKLVDMELDGDISAYSYKFCNNVPNKIYRRGSSDSKKSCKAT